MKAMRWLQRILVGAGVALLLLCAAPSVQACVEGLDWGMPLEQLEAHLGETQPLSKHQTGRYVIRNVLLDRLPVLRATFEIDPEQGLTQLAYAFAIDDMTEVLAGLRAQHGQPFSTNLVHDSHNEQVWVWNTGEDLITAVKQDLQDQQTFLISYKPSRLRPETL